MYDAAELLHKVNWFLKPIKDLILFLFTTKTGIALLIILLFLYLIYMTSKTLKQKKLLLEAARHRAIFTIWEILGVFLEQLGALAIKLVSNITVVLIAVLLLISVVGLSSAMDVVDNYVSNQKKIQDLKTVVKNLSQNYEVAKLKIINYDYNKKQTTFDIYFYDYAKNEYLPDKQRITIDGSQIYVLSLMINFDYSQIETGKKLNLAIPFKVFSEKVPSSDAIPLNVMDSTGIPYIYHRTGEQLYGIDSTTYSKLIKEIALYINDPKAARKAGVRSIIAAAPHNIKYPKRGQVFKIYVEQTGGMVIKQEEAF